MAKTQRPLTLTQDHVHTQLKTKASHQAMMVAPPSHGALFVRKAKVRVSAGHQPQTDVLHRYPEVKGSDVPLPLSQPPEEMASTSGSSPAAGAAAACAPLRGGREGPGRREPTAATVGRSAAAAPQTEAPESHAQGGHAQGPGAV
jgi:hypothetical protein